MTFCRQVKHTLYTPTSYTFTHRSHAIHTHHTGALTRTHTPHTTRGHTHTHTYAYTYHVCTHAPLTLGALLSPLSEVSTPRPAAQMRGQSSICPHSEAGPSRPLLFLFNDNASSDTKAFCDDHHTRRGPCRSPKHNTVESWSRAPPWQDEGRKSKAQALRTAQGTQAPGS